MEIVYQSWFALSSVDYDSDAENEDLWRICKRLGMLPTGNGFLVIYTCNSILVELCVFLSFSLFEGKKLKIDTFVEMHMYKLLENATVDFLFLFENIILL